MKEGVQEEVTLSSWIANSMHQNMDTAAKIMLRLCAKVYYPISAAHSYSYKIMQGYTLQG
jgi:hypothetical protein